jgi:hypothetical protein
MVRWLGTARPVTAFQNGTFEHNTQEVRLPSLVIAKTILLTQGGGVRLPLKPNPASRLTCRQIQTPCTGAISASSASQSSQQSRHASALQTTNKLGRFPNPLEGSSRDGPKKRCSAYAASSVKRFKSPFWRVEFADRRSKDWQKRPAPINNAADQEDIWALSEVAT